jgi:hypothetical protein
MSLVTLTNYGLGYGSSKNSPYQGCQTSMFGSCESIGGVGNKDVNYQSFTSLRPLSQNQKNMMLSKQAALRSAKLNMQLQKSSMIKHEEIPKKFIGVL